MDREKMLLDDILEIKFKLKDITCENREYLELKLEYLVNALCFELLNN